MDGNFEYPDSLPPSKKWTFAAYQYGSVPDPEPSLKEIKQKLVNHYEAFGATNINILYTRAFDYFPRWSIEETTKGIHWDMLDIQGKRNICYIGGGLSFDTTHNVIGYNNLLLDHMSSPLESCGN